LETPIHVRFSGRALSLLAWLSARHLVDKDESVLTVHCVSSFGDGTVCLVVRNRIEDAVEFLGLRTSKMVDTTTDVRVDIDWLCGSTSWTCSRFFFKRTRPAERRRPQIDTPEKYTKRTKSALRHNNDHDWPLPLR
jgi:hypothetical protein